MGIATLSPTQRYAAGGLLAIALQQAQIHHTQPLGSPSEEDGDDDGRKEEDSAPEGSQLWVHPSRGLLRPILRFLEIDSSAWRGLEETAVSSPSKHHIEAFLRILTEESNETTSETMDQELALMKAVDAMVISLETSPVSPGTIRAKRSEYELKCRGKTSSSKTESVPEAANALPETLNPANSKMSSSKTESIPEAADVPPETRNPTNSKMSSSKTESVPEAADSLPETPNTTNSKMSSSKMESVSEAADALPETLNATNSKTSSSKKESVSEAADALPATLNPINLKTMPGNGRTLSKSVKACHGDFIMDGTMVNYQRKVAVLFELLSACVADAVVDDKQKQSQLRKGYDARHRVALRLLASWLDVKWIKMEAMEVMVACSVMAKIKEEAEHEKQSGSPSSKWSKWKRGGIIGAAALTGGALMAITGGLAAPAIAAGFSALAPTLGTLVPVIGASGFAAAASAAGSVAGSVAVAASFGAAGAGLTGSKMARRIGDIDEFEFIPIGEHHSQGRLAVGVLVSGFVFEKEDFLRPWEGRDDNLERYALQWESKNLIAVSTAIQDWITSRLTMELMKQGAMVTVLSSLLTALAWPATLLAATDFIDSKWSIAIDRSDKAGKLLAEVLLNGLQGGRPVTLFGFSLGARVIFKCLQHLAESGDNEGIIERVVLLGAPISLNGENWETARKMVAGRFVNVYSTNDWTLGLAFRANLLTQGLAGIQPVNVQGIENVDVTDFIEGHSSYLWTTEEILGQLELDAYHPVFLSSPKKAE